MTEFDPGLVERLQAAHGHLQGRELLVSLLTGELAGKMAVTSSFGAESAVLLDLVAQVDRSLPMPCTSTRVSALRPCQRVQAMRAPSPTGLVPVSDCT